MAELGIESDTSDSSVRCATICATRPGTLLREITMTWQQLSPFEQKSGEEGGYSEREEFALSTEQLLSFKSSYLCERIH